MLTQLLLFSGFAGITVFIGGVLANYFNNDLNKYKSIIPCGISDKGVTSLIKIKKQDYNNLSNLIINNFRRFTQIDNYITVNIF